MTTSKDMLLQKEGRKGVRSGKEKIIPPFPERYISYCMENLIRWLDIGLGLVFPTFGEVQRENISPEERDLSVFKESILCQNITGIQTQNRQANSSRFNQQLCSVKRSSQVQFIA